MSAIKINAPINHGGAIGYLLWLRRDMPRVYLQVMQQVPAVAKFEGLLRKPTLGCCGLGDDAPTFDMSFDAGAASSDFSAAASVYDTSSGGAAIPVLDELTVTAPADSTGAVIDPSLTIPASDVSVVSPTIPQLPPIATPPAPNTGFWSGVGSVAAAVGNGVVQALPAVAQIVRAAAPVAIAAIQTNAALKGAYPYQTGYFTNPTTGQHYLSAIATPRSTAISGNFPTWAIAAAGVGALLLLTK
jgi:hypothetical protein